jgi:hypothetical protein
MADIRPTRYGSHLVAAWAFALLVGAASAGILVAAKADSPDPSSVEQVLKLRRPPVALEVLP